MIGYKINYQAASIAPIVMPENYFENSTIESDDPYRIFKPTFKEAKESLIDYWQAEMQDAKNYLDISSQKLMQSIKVTEESE
jgi:hypothetical protein